MTSKILNSIICSYIKRLTLYRVSFFLTFL
nr:MAG TPA: hypothetical protein [Bacteriophage sp.]DAI35867.1 MAG TPA: hypothetical protein [Caudoviricetes sp.]DAS32096.1 MAG TPA: hypothetical protein [Caudoviricetes sp.]